MAASVGQVALDIVMGKNTVSGVAKQAIADVQKTFSDGSSTISQKGAAIGNACSQMGAAIAPVSVAAQGVVATTAKASLAFESAMAQVKTIAGDTAVRYKGATLEMGDAVKKLSSDTGVAAEDIAGATYSAISAGVDTSKSVEFVAKANALAVGGFTDINTSVDVLTTAINAYGLTADDAGAISDKLITTQNLGKTTVNELASSMGKVIPAASAYGVSIDNLCGAYVSMTKGGIATAEATTYTKSMLNELADSGSSVGKILQEQTGKSFSDLMASGASLGDVIAILGDSVDGDSAAFAQLWGSTEAGTGALAILNGGTDDFNSTLAEMGNSTGAASAAMDTMTGTAGFQLQKALNDTKLAAIQLGDSFAPVVSVVASCIGGVANAFSALPGPVKTGIAVLLGVTAVLGPLLIAAGAIITFVSGTAIPVLTGLFAFIAANPITLVVAGIVAAGVLLVKHWGTVKEAAGKVWRAISGAVKSAVGAIKGAVTGAMAKTKEVVTNVWGGIKSVTSSVWNGIRGVVQTVVGFIHDNVLSNFTGMKNAVSNILNGLKQIISGIWTAIKTVVLGAALLILDVVTGNFSKLKSDVVGIFNNLKGAVSSIWNGMKAVISGAANAAKSIVTGAWKSLLSVSKSVFNGVKGAASSAWSGIKSTVSNAASAAKNGALSAFKAMKSGISSTVSGIASAVKSGFSSAISYITSLPSQAIGWGKDMIMGIVNGIKSVAGKVGDAVTDVADKIRSVLHFSVPDEGPLTDYETWMPDFVEGLTAGINNSKGKLIDAVHGMAGEMAFTPTLNAPRLQNTGRVQGAQAAAGSTSSADKLYDAIRELLEKLPGQSEGDIVVPVYLGNDLLDEQIVKANDRRTVRSGGRA